MEFEIESKVLGTLTIEDIEKMHDINELNFVIHGGKLFCIVE